MITDELVKQLGLPRQFWSTYLDNPTRFDCSETLKELDGSGLCVPPLERYAKTLWDYWERNFNDDATENRKLRRSVSGKVVVITGASSGIGEVVAHRVGRAGAHRDPGRPHTSKLDVIRDEIIDAGGDADVLHRRPLRPRRLRARDQGHPRGARRRSTCSSTTPAARSAARSRTRTTASTTSSARCSSTTSAR